eukprot:GHVU01116084.1.p1 GENE.GHVU01116084.1~~GHVU01116084.1.p1  ORF type:complete len:166 (+),score=5.65 GHVU01116084.1:213-710(+)
MPFISISRGSPYSTPYEHICLFTKAIEGNNITVVKLLIQYNCGVNSNARDGGNDQTLSAFRLAACHTCSLVVCEMLAIAGCDRMEMNECITEWDSKRLQAANAHLCQKVKAMATSPLKLAQLSRLHIRHNLKQLGHRLMEVSQLPLPKVLHVYLLFKELDNYIDA